MRPTTDAFAATVRAGSRLAVSRVSVLRADLSTEQVLSGAAGIVTGGYVSTDGDRRRSLNLDLVNENDAWAPDVAGDLLFPNRLLRVEQGLMVNGQPELVPLGLFLIDRPSTTRDAGGSTIRITGQDRLKLGLKSRFTVPTRYREGTAVRDVVRSIARDAGMGDELYRLAVGDRALGADRSYEIGEYRADALRQLALDFALALYVDADGYLVLAQAPTDATLGAPVWTFEPGDDAIMLGLTRELTDDRLYNHTLVSGESANLPPVRGEARITSLANPAHADYIGDRVWTYASAMIRSEEQAQAVADAELLKVALIEETIDVPSINHPALEAGDVVTINESATRAAGDYVLDSLTIPLGTGSMRLTAGAVRAFA